MRVTQVITDYVQKSILTTEGDIIVRGAAIPERLATAAVLTFLAGQGGGVKPAYVDPFAFLTTEGDIVIRGVTARGRLAGGAIGKVLRAGGAGVKPSYEFDKLGYHGIDIGSYARSTAGDVVVSTLSFRPSVIFFIATCITITNAAFCVGFDDGTEHVCCGISDDGSAVVSVLTHSSMVKESGGNYIQGLVSAFAADGFTVTHTISGAAGMNVFFLALG